MRQSLEVLSWAECDKKGQQFKLFYVKIQMPHNLGLGNEPNNGEARTLIT